MGVRKLANLYLPGKGTENIFRNIDYRLFVLQLVNINITVNSFETDV